MSDDKAVGTQKPVVLSDSDIEQVAGGTINFYSTLSKPKVNVDGESTDDRHKG